MCQRFGALFLFGLVWQYSSVQKKYNEGRFNIMATYLQQFYNFEPTLIPLKRELNFCNGYLSLLCFCFYPKSAPFTPNCKGGPSIHDYWLGPWTLGFTGSKRIIGFSVFIESLRFKWCKSLFKSCLSLEAQYQFRIQKK